MKIIQVLLLFFILCGCNVRENEESKINVCKFDAPRLTKVSFVGVGDNLIHGSINTSSKTENGYDFSSIYENIVNDVQQSDIAFVNQETPIGGESLGISGYPMFNSPYELIDNLHDVGFNLVNLATNHSLDRYEKGIVNELNAFSEYEDMIIDGAYASQEDFDTIPTFEIDGITFSFLAYTYGTNGIQAPNSYNISYLNEAQIRKDVQKAKEISDVIIVSAHWGEENSFTVSSYQKQYAQLFADLEVDVVIGTHPHVLQPIEWIKGKNGNETLVAYSLGNFLGGMLGVDNAISGMLQFDFVKRNDEITIENISFEPLFIHFERYGDDIVDDRNHYKIYKVSEYTDELATEHALNGYNGQKVSIDYIQSIIHKMINADYLE